MQRDVGMIEEENEAQAGQQPVLKGRNWTEVQNGSHNMYVLGKATAWNVPLEWHRETKLAVQSVSNYRYGNIAIPQSVKSFKRLYFRNTVFHSAEVRTFVYFLMYLHYI